MNRFAVLASSVILVACAADPAVPRGSGDLVGAPDAVTPDANTADAVLPDALSVDAALGDGSGGDVLAPSPPPEVRALSIDWAFQAEVSDGAWIGPPTTLALADGGLALVALFNGTATFGERTLSASADPYAHLLFARITADGEVAALTRLCDRCASFGGVALAERADGSIALASVADGAVVLAPDAPDPVHLDADQVLFVALLTPDGALARWSTPARSPASVELRALAATPDGGLVVGGAAMGLEVDGGLAFDAEDGWHYPGRGFLLGVDAALAPRYAEQLAGAAGSDINMIHVDTDAITVVGDFGGYPLGVSTVFAAGTPEERTLASVSSDDDPAMDVFFARWTPPTGPALGRPRLAWARRVAHYSNGPRPATWTRSGAAPGEVELRLDGTTSVAPDDDGELRAPAYSAGGHLVVGLAPDGAVTPRVASVAPLVPAADGFVAVTTRWAGAEIALGAAADAPRFAIPARTSGPDGVNWTGHALSTWRADGALVAAGLLLARVDASRYPLSIHRVVGLPDASALFVFHGSAPTTLVPGAGPELTLGRGVDSGYERVVVVRARLE